MTQTEFTGGDITAAGYAMIVAALFVGVVNVIAAWAAAKSAVNKAIAPVASEVKEIKAHVNSEKTRDQGVIATQKQEIDLLREMNSELKKTTALLAQTQSAKDLMHAVSQAAVAGATTPTSQVPPIVVVPTPTAPLAPVASVPSVALVAPVDEVLKAIEKNTEETATNTKKTDDNVQELRDKA